MSPQLITRREQLQLLALGASAPLLYGISSLIRRAGRVRPERGAGRAVIQQYNTLGATGLKVSDVGFGVSCSIDPQLLVNAYERGINYFDISPLFTWSVDMLSDAFARHAHMKKHAIVASKIECMSIVETMQCQAELERRSAFRACESCIDDTLRKLGRTHVDILQLHGVGQNGPKDLEYLDPDTARGAAVMALLDDLKRKGKVRFAGVSTHGPKVLDQVVERVVRGGNFDMVMAALNFMQEPTSTLERSLREADQRGVGVTAMKVLANARRAQVRQAAGRPFSHAAIAWALSRPGVNNMVITVDSAETLDEYIAASAHKLTAHGRMQLARHRAATSQEYCRVACGRCAHACPAGVDIPTLLRIDQYRTLYGKHEIARERYAGFAGAARLQACLGCTDPVCEKACPFRLPMHSRLKIAYQQLEHGNEAHA